MSGGDLDGDTYMVIWDNEFVKDFKPFEAAVYEKKSHPDPVGMDEADNIE